MDPSPSRALLLGLVASLAVGCGGATARAPSTILEVPHPASAGRRETPAPASAPAPPAALPLTPSDVSFLGEVDGRSVVILEASADDAWRTSEPALLGGGPAAGGLVELSAEIDSSRLPDTHRLSGQRFALYRGTTHLCDVSLGHLSLAGELWEPGFDWAGSPQRTPPATPREIADEAWGYASKWLVADVKLDAACAGATWGRLASLPPIEVASITDVSPGDAARAWSELPKLDGYDATQSAFVDWETANAAASSSAATPTLGPWESSPTAARSEWAFAWHGTTYVAVGASIGETCGFHGELFGAFRVVRGRLTRVARRDAVPPSGILVDLNHDGLLEVLSGADGDGEKSVQPFLDDDGPRVFVSAASPGCPC
jgi:hypothetical protein